jgi:type VI secretion system protein ImpK
MPQRPHNTDDDKTSIMISDQANHESSSTFTAVAVAANRKAPHNAPYLAQQTSFDEYTPGLNPLVNAASKLLLEIVKLRESKEIDLEALRSRLEAEIRGFNSHASAFGISEAQVNAAQYLLCTALDESVTTSTIPGSEGEWQQKSLLSTFHKDTWGGEVFFDVTSRTMEQPASRLYLLELIYLLLSLGFEGKYRLMDRGPLSLESLRDQLYRQIRLLRGEASPDLAKKPPTTSIKDKIYAYVPNWLVASIVCFCLSVSWWGFSQVLSGKAQPLATKYMSHATAGRPFILSVQPEAGRPEATDSPREVGSPPEVQQ